MLTDRPDHTPTPNDDAPMSTPNPDAAPPRSRGDIIDRQRREAATRLLFARRYFPRANQKDADRICFIRRDEIAHPIIPRGKRGRG